MKRERMLGCCLDQTYRRSAWSFGHPMGLGAGGTSTPFPPGGLSPTGFKALLFVGICSTGEYRAAMLLGSYSAQEDWFMGIP